MENLQTIFAQAGELSSDKTLSDKSTLVQPVQVPAETSYPVNAGDVTFSIGAKTDLSVQLFNDEDDNDDDGFLSTKDADITFNTATDAYLKYSVIVNPKANAQGLSTTDIGFNFAVSADLLLKNIFYKKHSNADKLNNDFLFDVSHFKTIFTFEDVQNLEVDDALCFKAATELTSNVQISWCNILSQSLSLLTKKLPVPVTFDIQLSPSFTAAFNLYVKDDFNYFIKKTDINNCLVKLSKAKNTKAGLMTGLSISTGFANNDDANQQLNILFDIIAKSITGYNRADVDNVITKFQNAADPLSDIEKQLINTLLGLFKLNSVTNVASMVADAWQSLKDDITNTLAFIANAHVEASFAYEYSMINENQEFLSVNIPTAILQTYHSSLLRFNANTILNDIRKNAAQSVQLNSYLNEKTVDIQKTWGFGFKLFNIDLSGKDSSDCTVVKRSDINGHPQITLDYSRGYKWILGKGSGKWMGELMCNMQSYSKLNIATLNEFDYALQLTTVLTDPVVRDNDFKEYLDTAVLIGAVKQEDIDKLFSKYIGVIAGKPVTIQTQLVFNAGIFQSLILQLGHNGWNNDTIIRFAAALSAAMKFMPEYDLRSTVQKRINTYSNLWQQFIINNLSDDPREIANTVSSTIEHVGNPDNLAAYEESGWDTSMPDKTNDSFSGVVYLHPDLKDDIRSFINGLSNLASGINANINFDTKKFNRNIYSNLKPLFAQTIYIRTLSYFLLQYAISAGLADRVVKVFTLTYGSGSDEQVINFTVN
jgi:hypothetical protein